MWHQDKIVNFLIDAVFSHRQMYEPELKLVVEAENGRMLVSE